MASIFDTTTEANASNFKLWSKVTKSIRKSSTIITGLIGKKLVKNSKVEDREFFLTETHLYYKRQGATNKYGKAMELTWARVSKEAQIAPEDRRQGYHCALRIVFNYKYTHLFFKGEEECFKWLSAMRRIAIMTDFLDHYTIDGRLGNGSFAEVRFLFLLDFLFFWIFGLVDQRFYRSSF